MTLATKIEHIIVSVDCGGVQSPAAAARCTTPVHRVTVLVHKNGIDLSYFNYLQGSYLHIYSVSVMLITAGLRILQLCNGSGQR